VEERSGRSMELSWHNNTLRLEQTHDLTADRKLLETADRNYPTNVADIGQDLARISFTTRALREVSELANGLNETDQSS